MNVVPTHSNFLFPRLKIKLKGRNFDETNEYEILVVNPERREQLDCLCIDDKILISCSAKYSYLDNKRR
jgi:hypothetical protein